MDRLVIVAIILETIVLSKMCLVLLVTAFKVGFQKNLEKNAVLLPPYWDTEGGRYQFKAPAEEKPVEARKEHDDNCQPIFKCVSTSGSDNGHDGDDGAGDEEQDPGLAHWHVLEEDDVTKKTQLPHSIDQVNYRPNEEK